MIMLSILAMTALVFTSRYLFFRAQAATATQSCYSTFT